MESSLTHGVANGQERFPQELPLLLRAVGLQLTARYGDFSGGPLTAASLNQVCLAVSRSWPK